MPGRVSIVDINSVGIDDDGNEITVDTPLDRADLESYNQLAKSSQIADYEKGFNAKQLLAIDFMSLRKPGDSYQKLAEQLGVTRVTIYNWLRNPKFKEAVRIRTREFLMESRGKALFHLTNNLQMPQMQNIFWKLTGDLVDKREITGKDGKPIEVVSKDASVVLDKLSVNVKMLILYEMTTGKEVKGLEDIIAQIESQIGTKIDDLQPDTMAEAETDICSDSGANTEIKMIGSGSTAGSMADIEANDQGTVDNVFTIKCGFPT